MKRWATVWSSFPPGHKKRCYQGIGGYLLLSALVGAWIGINGAQTAKDWRSRIPSGSAVIKNAIEVAEEATEGGVPAQVAAPADPTFDRNASVFSDGRTYIALIMSDMGLSAAATDRALSTLPKQVSLAFSPYAPDLQTWLQKAAAAQRETLLYIPMESASYPQEDPGPRALSSRLSDDENSDNLEWVLKKAQGSVGVINFMGSRFLTDKKRLAPVLDTLKKNQSIFIESIATDRSAVPALAGEIDLPYLSVDLKIDDNTTEDAIREKLSELEKTAKSRGFAVGIAEPYPLTVNTIKSWAASLAKRGIVLAPLKTVWKNKPHDERLSPAQEPAPK